MTNVQIISNARSGSTYLFQVLRHYVNPTQPWFIIDRYSLNEPFNNYHIKKTFPNDTGHAIISGRLAQLENATSPLVMKNHIKHVNYLAVDYPDLFARYNSLDIYTFILLRRNLFNAALSYCIARATDEWTTYSVQTPFTIAPDLMSECISEVAVNTLHLLQHNNNNGEYVYYEDFEGRARHDYSNLKWCHTHKDSLRAIDIKEVDQAPSKADMIVNYDELYKISVDTLDTMVKSGMLAGLQLDGCMLVTFDIQL